MSNLEIFGAIAVIAFMVWVFLAKPDPHAGYVHYLEQPPTGGVSFPVGCIPPMIVIVLVLGVALLYMMWMSKPG